MGDWGRRWWEAEVREVQGEGNRFRIYYPGEMPAPTPPTRGWQLLRGWGGRGERHGCGTSPEAAAHSDVPRQRLGMIPLRYNHSRRRVFVGDVVWEMTLKACKLIGEGFMSDSEILI